MCFSFHSNFGDFYKKKIDVQNLYILFLYIWTMPANKYAILRYRIIDQMIRKKFNAIWAS